MHVPLENVTSKRLYYPNVKMKKTPCDRNRNRQRIGFFMNITNFKIIHFTSSKLIYSKTSKYSFILITCTQRDCFTRAERWKNHCSIATITDSRLVFMHIPNFKFQHFKSSNAVYSKSDKYMFLWKMCPQRDCVTISDRVLVLWT
jgi:hypothetical protein